jgi:hypothetical protein
MRNGEHRIQEIHVQIYVERHQELFDECLD